MLAYLRIGMTILVGVLLAAPRPAAAIPGTFTFGDDPRCDPHEITLTHELGEAPAFPKDELISALSAGLNLPLTCTTLGPTDPPMADDFLVTITNLSPFSWIELFFVADEGILFGNVDGTIKGGNAFKIDTSGINTPLLSESIASDLIFSPGESWTFIVQDWRFVAVPDIMGSIGVGSESDDATGSSWSSIVAICLDCPIPVPEPGSLALLVVSVVALGGVAVCERRRRRASMAAGEAMGEPKGQCIGGAEQWVGSL